MHSHTDVARLSPYEPWSFLEWMDDDSKENFDLHWGNPQAKKQLERNGFTYETNIEYHIDQYGLRNGSGVDISNSILTLGCSYTFGTGLNVSDIWSSILAKSMNESVYNAGIPGSSNDGAFRVADYIIPKYKPLAVVLLSPFEFRYEFYDKLQPYEYSASMYTIWVDRKQEIDLASELHNKLNAKKNILAIQCLCNEYDIPFIWETVDNARAGADKNDLARDLLHFGKESHNLIATRFSNRLTLNKKTV